MTHDQIKDLARESGLSFIPEANCPLVRIVQKAVAMERSALYAERGTPLFNPYTGKARHPSDIASDPNGILMVEPEALLRARGPKA